MQCELIVEEEEDNVLETFANEETTNAQKIVELCETRTKICKGLKKKYRDEL